MTTRRLAPVDAEIFEALEYYKAIEPRLAARLVNEFEAAIRRIEHYPNGWRALDDRLRQCVVRGFPYVIIYSVVQDGVVIVAFAHTHRRPGYWRDRLK
jgi:plasmid stabilization system protein ParE